VIREAIKKVVTGQHLAENEAGEVLEEIMDGAATPAQIASFLTALHLKGETVEEITGFARVMRRRATPVRSSFQMLLDTCGTGGDGASTFNISTTAAFLLAGAGLPVAKHGNRSVSSRCGSADVLEALGVRVDLEPGATEECLSQVGIAFLFAPLLHKAMGNAAGPRREIGIRTIFNILGPLTNPAGAQAQVLGVYNPSLTEIVARVLARLGSTRAFVVHGAGGLDEVSLAGPTVLCEVKNGSVRKGVLEPEKFGFAYAPVSALAGGSAEENALIIRSVLSGEKGPRRDAVVLNAALGLVAGERAGEIKSAIRVAEESIDSGAALGKLEELVDFTRKMAPRKAAAQ
jgi:anthranilate phosphoribosyltransferase